MKPGAKYWKLKPSGKFPPDLFTVPECYGNRAEAWDKCETCKYIADCSRITLKGMFPNAYITGP